MRLGSYPVPVHARSVPARSVVLTAELPFQRPASPEMNESPSDTIAVGPLARVAWAAGEVRARSAQAVATAGRRRRDMARLYHEAVLRESPDVGTRPASRRAPRSSSRRPPRTP